MAKGRCCHSAHDSHREAEQYVFDINVRLLCCPWWVTTCVRDTSPHANGLATRNCFDVGKPTERWNPVTCDGFIYGYYFDSSACRLPQPSSQNVTLNSSNCFGSPSIRINPSNPYNNLICSFHDIQIDGDDMQWRPDPSGKIEFHMEWKTALRSLQFVRPLPSSVQTMRCIVDDNKLLTMDVV